MKLTLKHAEQEQLNLETIICDGRFQIRESLDESTVADYAEAYKNHVDDMPSLAVWRNAAGDTFLVCGHHRFEAAKQAGIASLPCKIIEGDERKAKMVALQDNKTHGLRMTNADKRRAVEIMLSDPEWAKWSDRKIAQAVGVHHNTVASCRRSLSGELLQIEVSETNETEPETRKVERNGTVYEQKVRQPKPAQEVEADPIEDEVEGVDWLGEDETPQDDEVEEFSPSDSTSDDLDVAIANVDRVQAVGEEMLRVVEGAARALRSLNQQEPSLKPLRHALNEQIAQLRLEVKQATTAHVCPHCLGKGCKSCNGHGYFPRLVCDYESFVVQPMCKAVAERKGCEPHEVAGWRE